MTTKALVVLSGGQDSTTCLFWAIRRYGRENVSTITFDYGQRHRLEISAAADVAGIAGIPAARRSLKDLSDSILDGTSPLTNQSLCLEQYESAESMGRIIGTRVEKTFVPMRNALFLTIAANRAVVIGATEIVTGVCEQDNANYPDCRVEFIRSQEKTINMALGVKAAEDWVFIRTPLMSLTKAASIRLAMKMQGAYGALAFSHTAYDGKYPPIGRDHASLLRAQGFLEAGVPDPLVIKAVECVLMPAPRSENYTPDRIRTAIEHIRDDLSDMPESWKWWKHAR